MKNYDSFIEQKLFTDNGFLRNPEMWNEAIARRIAINERIFILSEAHFVIIDKLRSMYFKSNKVPMVGTFCRKNDIHIRDIFSLFPTGYSHGAIKVAGLPKPDFCES